MERVLETCNVRESRKYLSSQRIHKSRSGLFTSEQIYRTINTAGFSVAASSTRQNGEECVKS